MYRPHLVHLPCPLLGLCLKLVPLLLAIGSSAHKVPSVHDEVACDEFDEKPLKKIGSKLNDGNLFPGQIPRRFCKSDNDFFQTPSVTLYEELT